jgi:hypothetical protein
VVVGEVLADRFRPDLARAGKGSAHCSFIFALPGGGASRLIRARRRADGAALPSVAALEATRMVV